MNTLIISVCIIIIIVIGHLYLRNILTNNIDNKNNFKKSMKNVTFNNNDNVRYIPNN